MTSTTLMSALRLLQFAMALVVIGITGHILATRTFYSGKHGLEITLLIFAIFAAIAALFGLFPALTRHFGGSIASTVLDAIMVIFFFIAATYTSAKIEPDCHRYRPEQDVRTGLFWDDMACRWSPMFRALEAFCWMLPILFALSALTNFYHSDKGLKNQDVEKFDVRRDPVVVDQPRAKDGSVLSATV